MAITRYRPARADDGEGGSTETPGDAYPCWGALMFDDNTITIVIEKNEDVIMGDWIAVADESGIDPDAYYRVMEVQKSPRGSNRKLTLERMARPIWMAPLDYLLFEGERLTLEGEFLSL